jgi:HlyD family secretion protein
MFYTLRHRFIFLAVLALSLALIGCVGCARTSATDKSGKNSSGTIAVKRGNFRRTLRLTGTINAVESFRVFAPRLSGQMTGSGTMIITKIIGNGTSVREEDVLVEFDQQTQQKNILDRQAEYDGYLQQIRKKKADQTAARIADETELKGAEVDVKSALVEMRKNELIPKYQAEINKANLAEAEAQLKQLKETFTLKRQAEAADLQITEIQRDRALLTLNYAKSNVDKMTIRSSMNGLAVLTPINKGSKMMAPQEGDEIRPGGAIMQVVNPSAMRVAASINQVDVAKLRVGQSAEIRLDAYPDLNFQGKVERITSIAGSDGDSKKIRLFSVVISIQGQNPNLLPDLSSAVDIWLENLNGVLLLPRHAIVQQNGQSWTDVLTNGKLERRPVKLGLINDYEAVIESGLQEGTIVSLNPKE